MKNNLLIPDIKKAWKEMKTEIASEIGLEEKKDMDNKPKPDDRRDNVDRIQFNIDNTIKNYRLAEQMIAITDDEKTKRDLIAKNERREESLKGMKEEIKDEAEAKERGYK